MTASDSFFIGATGEAIIKAIFNKWKISASKIAESDFGEDLLCDIFIASEDGKTNIRTNLTFRVQVKTTQQISKEGYIRKTKKGFSFSLETSLLELWADSYYPVILVIWDLEHNCGYWCAPLLEHTSTTIPETDTTTIHFRNDMSLDKSEKAIKDYVQEYYNGLLKLGISQYQCFIYPIWMPKYRIFTFPEVLQYFAENTSSTIKLTSHYSDLLPSFLTSYNNINLDGGLPCIQFIDNADSLSNYIFNLRKYLSTTSINFENGEWITFIVSPIEIIQEDYRVISKMTDWIAFSKVNKQLIIDREYTFELGSDFYYTQKVRSTSSDHNFFIHNTGDFAIEILATGFSIVSRKAYNSLIQKYLKRAICIWNVASCNSSEKDQLAEWCYTNNFTYNLLEENPDIIVISHNRFSKGTYGFLFPGAIKWSDFESFNLSSDDFISRIPYGVPASQFESEKVLAVYLNLSEEITEESIVQYEQLLSGEALNHKERLIHFVSYIHPINNEEFQASFEMIKSDFDAQFQSEEIEVDLFVDYFDGIADLILDVRPKWNISTKEVVDLVCPYFMQIIDKVRYLCYQKGNMAYYIKYNLDRYLPEELVRYSTFAP